MTVELYHATNELKELFRKEQNPEGTRTLNLRIDSPRAWVRKPLKIQKL